MVIHFFLLVIAGDMSFVTKLATIHTIFKQMRGKRKKPFNGTNINYIALAKEINYGFSMKIYYSFRTLYAGPSAYFVQIARNPMLKFC